MTFTELLFNLPADPTSKCKISVLRPIWDSPILIWSYGGSPGFSQRHPSFVKFKRQVAEAGVMMATYDYRGMCGDRDFRSTSLETRINDLMGVYWLIRSHYPNSRLVLGGNSMGGYTTIASLPYIGRESAIVLLAPAAYHWKAKYATFGPQFSEIIRRNESWKDSDAFPLLDRVVTPTLFIYCQDDEVIPPDITDRYIRTVHLDKSEIAFLPGGHKVFAEEIRVSTLANMIISFLKNSLLFP